MCAAFEAFAATSGPDTWDEMHRVIQAALRPDSVSSPAAPTEFCVSLGLLQLPRFQQRGRRCRPDIRPQPFPVTGRSGQPTVMCHNQRAA